jgi:hypothetical protein
LKRSGFFTKPLIVKGPSLEIHGRLALRRQLTEILGRSNGAQRSLSAVVQIATHVRVAHIHPAHQVAINRARDQKAQPPVLEMECRRSMSS